MVPASKLAPFLSKAEFDNLSRPAKSAYCFERITRLSTALKDAEEKLIAEHPDLVQSIAIAASNRPSKADKKALDDMRSFRDSSPAHQDSLAKISETYSADALATLLTSDDVARSLVEDLLQNSFFSEEYHALFAEGDRITGFNKGGAQPPASIDDLLALLAERKAFYARPRQAIEQANSVPQHISEALLLLQIESYRKQVAKYHRDSYLAGDAAQFAEEIRVWKKNLKLIYPGLNFPKPEMAATLANASSRLFRLQ